MTKMQKQILDYLKEKGIGRTEEEIRKDLNIENFYGNLRGLITQGEIKYAFGKYWIQ